MAKSRNFLLASGFFLFFGVIILAWPVSYFINNNFTGTKVCTITSAELSNSSSGGATSTPSRFLFVQSSDCGQISITKTKHPDGMSDAALAKFLNEHQGERFEFVTKFFQFSDSLNSWGISSTEPVK